MKVHIDKIGPDGFSLSEPVTQAWFEAGTTSAAGVRIMGEGSFEALLHRLDDVVHVRDATYTNLPIPNIPQKNAF